MTVNWLKGNLPGERFMGVLNILSVRLLQEHFPRAIKKKIIIRFKRIRT